MISQLLRSLSIFAVALRLLVDYLWLDFTDRFRSEGARREAETRTFRRWGKLLRRTALRLHGLIIKVGQFLSARADVFPESFTRELSSLQDAVPAAPYAAIRKRVEAELGAPLESIFAEFQPEAVASASLGQVHRARLKEGPEVAVKVLRPGIERLVATDLAALRRIMRWVQKYTRFGRRFDLQAIMDEFQTITYQEIDYRLEAENIRRFRKNFAGVPGIDVPFPYDNLVSEKLLVMEFKDGLKVNDREKLQAAGISPAELAGRLVDAYLKQLITDGFVHVDPHPGNLMVQTDGTLVFVDFGMMGTITPDDRRHLSALVANLLTRNLDGAVQDLRNLGFLRGQAEAEPLKKAMTMLLDHLGGVPIKPGPEMDAFLADFREWLYEEPLQFPARFLYMGRAVGLLAGLCSGLDPAIDWVKVLKERALPLLEATARGPEEPGGAAEGQGFNWRKTVSDLFGPGASTVVDTVIKQAGATGLSLVRLPGQLERTLGKLESGAVKVQVEMPAMQEQLEFQSRLVSRLTWGLLTAAAGIAGTLLATGGLQAEARVAWGLGALFLLALLGNMLTGRRPRRRRPPHARMR